MEKFLQRKGNPPPFIGNGGKTSRISPWIKHVLDVKSKNGISYKEALKKAKKTYKRGGNRIMEITNWNDMKRHRLGI